MNPQATEEVLKIIKDVLLLEDAPNLIDELKVDLGADSLDYVTLQEALEVAFPHVEISNADMEACNTVDDVIRMVDGLMNETGELPMSAYQRAEAETNLRCGGELRPDQIQYVLDNPGLWMGSDTNEPRAEIPMLSWQGRLYQLKRDGELTPEGFAPTARFRGPLRAHKWKDSL